MKKAFGAISFFSVVFFSVYSFTACEETGSNDDLKVEYSLEAVNKAIVQATKNHDPSDIKTNQFVKYEDNYQIELTDPKISGTVENEILEVIDEPDQYIVTLLETITSFDEDGNSTEEVSEQKVTLTKDASILKSSNLSLLKGVATNSLINNNFSLKNDSKLKIYNLKIDDAYIPYPNSIQKKMGCHKDNPCKFRGTRIQFIVHEYVNKTDPTEFSVDRIYMTNGSFLNGTFSSCISRFFDGPERDYYIKQCSVLRDYGAP